MSCLPANMVPGRQEYMVGSYYAHHHTRPHCSTQKYGYIIYRIISFSAFMSFADQFLLAPSMLDGLRRTREAGGSLQ